ncbi:MAG TPA: hypothetical protein VJ810_04760 [Blastocatellia bacterium]|nr:hypothetical protein [Blastocatellia bacterium]
MAETEKRQDPEAVDPNNQPAVDNPILLVRDGREIRFERIYKKFVDHEPKQLGYIDENGELARK